MREGDAVVGFSVLPNALTLTSLRKLHCTTTCCWFIKFSGGVDALESVKLPCDEMDQVGEAISMSDRADNSMLKESQVLTCPDILDTRNGKGPTCGPFECGDF